MSDGRIFLENVMVSQQITTEFTALSVARMKIVWSGGAIAASFVARGGIIPKFFNIVE